MNERKREPPWRRNSRFFFIALFFHCFLIVLIILLGFDFDLERYRGEVFMQVPCL